MKSNSSNTEQDVPNSRRMKELERNALYYTQLRYILGEFLKSSEPTEVLIMILHEIATLTGGKPSIAVEYTKDSWDKFSLEYYEESGTWVPTHQVSNSLYSFLLNHGDAFVNLEDRKVNDLPSKIATHMQELGVSSFISLPLDGNPRMVIEVYEMVLPERIERYFEAVKEFIIPLRLSIQHAILLEESNRARRRADLLLDLLFHDIRGSLGNLLIELELMQMKWDDQAKAYNLLQDAMDQATEANNLINRVKKVLTRRTDKELFECDLMKTLESSIVSIKTAFSTYDLNIRINSNLSSRILVHADDLLHDIFINLLSNAVKAMEHKEEEILIEIEPWGSESDYIRVGITDRGKGMPEELKPRIAGRFLTESADGVGLGLSIVMRVIEDYGGSLWFDNRDPEDWTKGTIANIALKIADDGK